MPKRSIRKLSQNQKTSSTKLAIQEEEPQTEADDCNVNDQYDDDTASKGSKESDNEKVIDTMYDKERDGGSAAEPVKNQMIRRKSMAPPVLHE